MKTVIACGDGAIRGGYIAGVFFALKKYCPDVWNSVTDFTGTSTSVGGLFYEEEFGVNNPGRKLWTKDFADPDFINKLNFFTKGKVYNIDYLVDVILKQKNPLSISSIHESKYGYYFPLINYDSNKTIIFNNRGITTKGLVDYELIEPSQVYEYIRSATAAPILYDLPVQIGDDRFIDAGIRMPYFLDETIFKDHKKIVISTKNPFESSDGLICKLLGTSFKYAGPLFGANLKPEVYEEIANKPKKFKELKAAIEFNECGKDTLYIYPSKKLGGLFDNSESTLRSNYELGEKDLIENLDYLNNFILE